MMGYIKNAFLGTMLCLFLSPALNAQDQVLNSSLKIAAHPRLLLLKGEEVPLKACITADKTWNNIHLMILAECDALIKTEPVKHIKTGKRLLDVSREALRRIFFLSYAWRMTSDEEYMKRAEKELLAVSNFNDWNPSHFLDVAEMTMAVAIGYDWLYDVLPKSSRAIVKAGIMKNGLSPSMETRYNSWLKQSHNWNQVCNAGISYGALAVYEDDPELAVNILNRAVSSIRLPMEEYGPDGAYPEGYGYWNYGTSFNVMFISAIEHLFKQDFGLSKIPGFLKTAGFLENMTGPSGNAFNFFDSGVRGNVNPAMFWFAGKLQDPSLLWVEQNYLNKEPARLKGDRILPALMIWGAGQKLNEIAPPKGLTYKGDGTNPVFMMRTSWSDPNAIYIGMKGGSPRINHGHMDAGSFVMDANGIRWAMDFGMQGYESLESKGVDLWNMNQNSQRWQVFRYNNFAHNTLAINNQLQNVKGFAPITSSSSAPGFMNAITDLTAVYQNDIKKANRGIAILNKQQVVIKDELESLSKETTVRWSLLTAAKVNLIGKNKVELQKNGKRLIITAPEGITFRTWSTTPVHDYDAPNPGTSLVGFEIVIPPDSKKTITVLLTPGEFEKSIIKDPGILASWPHSF